MTDVPSGWRVDESVRETSYTDNAQEFPEYIAEQPTPATKTYAGYVSPDESTYIAVGELNHPGRSDETGLFVYLYEVARGVYRDSFWLFNGGDDVARAKEITRQLVVAREETSYAHSDVEFIPDLRDRVPDLSVHTEFTSDSYSTEYVEEQGISFELPDPTGHPLEDYLPGYVAGSQLQQYMPCFECLNPDCSREIEGGNQLSWELNSTLYLGQSDEEEFIPVGWQCAKHSTDSLDSFMAEVPDPDVVSEWETRMDEEQSLINQRLEELEEAGAFDDDESIDFVKRQQARQELEDEGILEEDTLAEKEERAQVTSMSRRPDIERYYLVRCDLDCMCFGAYYQNLTYVRNPVVVDERKYA
jgi:hypothetical protein